MICFVFRFLVYGVSMRCQASLSLADRELRSKGIIPEDARGRLCRLLASYRTIYKNRSRGFNYAEYPYSIAFGRTKLVCM